MDKLNQENQDFIMQSTVRSGALFDDSHVIPKNEVKAKLLEMQSQLQAAQAKIKELEQAQELAKQVFYCCDAIKIEYNNDCHGAAREWLRHLVVSYEEYEDSLPPQPKGE